MQRSIAIAIILLLIGCTSKPNEMIPFISGYWEITNVKKDNEVVMEYSYSPIIDYWQVNEDLSGFRKKVMPNLDGKLIVTQHSMKLEVKPENGNLNVYYNDNGNSYMETIVRATTTELVITNEEGLIYTYKPYQQINLDDE